VARIPRSKKEGEEFARRVLAEGWRDDLLKTINNSPKPCLANAIIAFSSALDWAGILYFDTHAQRTLIKGKLPWLEYQQERFWEPKDDTLATNWLQHQGIMLKTNATAEAIEIVSRKQTFHPIIDYLKQCHWDADNTKDSLLDTWTIRFLGAKDTPFIRAVSARWMISAVARVYQPGCKADCAIIFEGVQGLGKSNALRTLFHPWFTDEIPDLGSRDASIQIAGIWCVELAELVGMRRGDIDRIKAFISRSFDRYRPLYGMRSIDQPRQCVFAGTVNDSSYLRDETGNRRFWPISCSLIDIDGLAAIRDQLWAEARDRYETGEAWWLESDDLNRTAAIEQAKRRVIDPWEAKIASLVDGVGSTTATDVLGMLDIKIGDQNQIHANRVASALKALGWHQKSMRYNGKSAYRYVPPDVAPPTAFDDLDE
jgi:predicted P-loop ATPase